MGFSTKTILIGFFLGIVLWVEGCSPSLHDAASEGNIEKLRTLIEQGADVNAKDIDGWTPLHHAARKGDKRCVELLLAKGAAVDACEGKNYGILGMVAPLPAYILASSANETPLHWAAQQGHLEVVKLLLDHGADVNAKNKDGETPLLMAFTYVGIPKTKWTTSGFPNDTHWYMEHQSEETIKLLLERGADVNIHGNSIGWATPLHYAVFAGNKELVKLILDHGANINAPSYIGDTPLHGAVRGSLLRTGTKFKIETDKELVKLLLDHGADVNAKEGFWGPTPLKSAKDREIKELLRQYGAKE